MRVGLFTFILFLSFFQIPGYASNLSNYFSRCILEGSSFDSPFSKYEASNNHPSGLKASCSGTKARILFDAVRPYSKQFAWSDDSGNELQARKFGASDAIMQSQCNRQLWDANGNSSDKFYCSFYMNISEAIVNQLGNTITTGYWWNKETKEVSISSSLKSCLDSGILSKVRVNETGNTALSLSCQGREAKTLFNEVRPYCIQSSSIWDENQEVVTRSFGQTDEVVQSQCNRQIANPNKSSSDVYRCNMVINVSSNLATALNLKQVSAPKVDRERTYNSQKNFDKCFRIYDATLHAHIAADNCRKNARTFQFVDNPNFDKCFQIYDSTLHAHIAANKCIEKNYFSFINNTAFDRCFRLYDQTLLAHSAANKCMSVYTDFQW
jgi:hypothetical protein